MTEQEALVEARRRWGAAGAIYDRETLRHIFPHLKGALTVVGRYWVGVSGGLIYGNGNSWEAAFADADRREQEASRDR